MCYWLPTLEEVWNPLLLSPRSQSTAVNPPPTPPQLYMACLFILTPVGGMFSCHTQCSAPPASDWHPLTVQGYVLYVCTAFSNILPHPPAQPAWHVGWVPPNCQTPSLSVALPGVRVKSFPYEKWQLQRHVESTVVLLSRWSDITEFRTKRESVCIYINIYSLILTTVQSLPF